MWNGELLFSSLEWGAFGCLGGVREKLGVSQPGGVSNWWRLYSSCSIGKVQGYPNRVVLSILIVQPVSLVKTKGCGKMVCKKVLFEVLASLYPEHPDHEQRMITSCFGYDKMKGVKT